jgi:hypothetical protein
MPVPNLITDLSTTPATNVSFINGDVDSVAVADNHLQTVYAFLRQIYDVSGTQALLKAQLDSQYVKKAGDLMIGALTAQDVAGNDFITSSRSSAGNVLNRWFQAGVIDWTIGLRSNDAKLWVSQGPGLGNGQAYFDLGGGFSVASVGSGHDPRGAISVTKPNTANFSYYGLTRVGILGAGIGLDSLGNLLIGEATVGGTSSTIAADPYFSTGPTSSRARGIFQSGGIPGVVAPNGGAMDVSSLATEQANAVLQGRRNGIGFGIGAEFTGGGNTGAWIGAWRATNNYGANTPGSLGIAICPEGASVTVGNYWGNPAAFGNIGRPYAQIGGVDIYRSFQNVATGASETFSHLAFTAGNNDGLIALQAFAAAGAAGNAANCAVRVRANSATSRSINAGGTINASGADYAEYEIKGQNCGLVEKGDLIGFDKNGQLTDRYDEAFSFGIKSTNPSYVGGDVWHLAAGEPPEIPDKEKHPEKYAEYEALKQEFDVKLEEARKQVDRVAYSGKVPVNLKGANVGDYIIATPSLDGGIAPRAVSDPDFKSYMRAVGCVRRILQDGRCEVAVIIH